MMACVCVERVLVRWHVCLSLSVRVSVRQGGERGRVCGALSLRVSGKEAPARRESARGVERAAREHGAQAVGERALLNLLLSI